jgi:assimilatory nitrate reductase catalytic subunit
LTTAAYCPVSRQPELKHAAVRIARAELPWSLLAMAWIPQGQALDTLQALRALMPQFAFASCVPFASPSSLTDNAAARDGVLLRCAAAEPPPGAVLAQIESILGLCQADVLRYADARRGQRRAMRLVRGADRTRLDAFLLAGDTRAESWVRTVLLDQLDARSYGRLLLLPGAQPPVAVAARGKAVCSCFDVAQSRIENQLAQCTGSASQRLESLQGALQCGTNCGSCLPELKRLVQVSMYAAAAIA